jgi:arginine/lysine/ornithine decarboxylase
MQYYSVAKHFHNHYLNGTHLFSDVTTRATLLDSERRPDGASNDAHDQMADRFAAYRLRIGHAIFFLPF